MSSARASRAGLAAVLVAWLGLLPCFAPARAEEIFLPLGFDQAVDRAAAEDRWVLVDFTAEWCAPCKAMDSKTWPDPDVRAWIAEHALALQVDVDEEVELARCFQIDTLPAVVMVADGEELDRVVGLQTPAELRRWFEGLEQGRTALESLRAWSPADDIGTRNVGTEHRIAARLVARGDYEEASPRLLWLWNHCLEHDPAFVGVRGSMMLMEIRQLVARHEPAYDAFAEVVARDEALVRRGGASEQTWMDWLWLTHVLDLRTRVVAWAREACTRQGEPGFPSPRLRSETVDLLLVEREWELALTLAGDVVDEARRRVEHHARNRDPTSPAHLDRFAARQIVEQLAELHAAALCTGRDREALQVATICLRTVGDFTARTSLAERALVHGQPRPEQARWLAATIDHTGNEDLRRRARRLLAHHEQAMADRAAGVEVRPYTGPWGVSTRLGQNWDHLPVLWAADTASR